MLAIRMQRRGRSGHAQFRVIVQDSRFSPKSGRVVAYVGSYDPHTKAASLDGEKIGTYLSNGAQPSDRVAKLLQKEGIKLPSWFKPSAPKTGKIRHPEKRRSTRPAGAPEPAKTTEEVPAGEAAESAEASAKVEPEAKASEETDEAPAAETPAEASETAAEEAPAETAEPPAEEPPAEAKKPAE